jgi:hypothetical protein
MLVELGRDDRNLANIITGCLTSDGIPAFDGRCCGTATAIRSP